MSTNESQTLTSIYTDDNLTCELCQATTNSNGSMVLLDECHHVYHIRCLVNHLASHRCTSSCNIHTQIKCPHCDIPIKDMRLSIAVSFKRNSVQELIECLTTY